MAEDLIDCIYEGNADILFACIRDRVTLEESSTEALKKDTLRDKNQDNQYQYQFGLQIGVVAVVGSGLVL